MEIGKLPLISTMDFDLHDPIPLKMILIFAALQYQSNQTNEEVHIKKYRLISDNKSNLEIRP
jgi:hypothetical protein